jgi:hypothetical protein
MRKLKLMVNMILRLRVPNFDKMDMCKVVEKNPKEMEVSKNITEK